MTTMYYKDHPVVAPSDIEGTPVGTIISFMGTSAPAGYLVCDGSMVAYSNYQALGDFFAAQFGSRNHFGGTTSNFALPDLRGLFLRGYGTESGGASSGNVGVKQAATNHTAVNITDDGLGLWWGATKSSVENSDASSISNTVCNYGSANSTAYSIAHSYTSRPVNTAVLYCIKYI